MSKPIKSILIEAYLEKRPALKRFLLARFRDDTIAEDILQEVYLKLDRSTFQKPVANTGAFLFKVANNLALDYRKKRQREVIRDHDWGEATRQNVGGEPVLDVPNAEEVLESRQKLACIRETLDGLPPQCRRVFILHKLEGLSHREVAEKLGVSCGTIEKHMSKALKKMALALQMLESGDD